MTRDGRHFFSESVEASTLAETLAREAFVATNPAERVHRAKLCADEIERFVIAVQHGTLADPKYAFYAVSKPARQVSVIEDDAAYRPKR
ncbi:MAG: hypothetical protein WKG01_09580 [Kofleriaceae bacterium]